MTDINEIKNIHWTSSRVIRFEYKGFHLAKRLNISLCEKLEGMLPPNAEMQVRVILGKLNLDKELTKKKDISNYEILRNISGYGTECRELRMNSRTKQQLRREMRECQIQRIIYIRGNLLTIKRDFECKVKVRKQ